MTRVPQIAADLLQGPSRQPWAISCRGFSQPAARSAVALIVLGTENALKMARSFTSSNSRRKFHSRFASSFIRMMWTPTAPSLSFQSATTSATAGSAGSTGLTMANRPEWAPLHFHRTAGVVAVQRKGGDEDRAVDADFVHRRWAGVPTALPPTRRIGANLTRNKSIDYS